MKIITHKLLKSWKPCENGYIRYCELFPKGVDIKIACKGLIEDDHIDWANWLICRVFNRKQKIQYAIYAAEQVIDIFEKKYPNDKRPRKAIKVAKSVLKSDTKKNRTYAAYAAADAKDAAYDAAAYAAYAASYAASYADADKAAAYDAAAYAAYAASYADATTRKKMQLKIIKYGLKLLGVKK